MPAEAEASAVKKSRKDVRGLTRLLGGVRELDVSLAILDELKEGHDHLAPAADKVRAFVEQERLRRRRVMVRGVERIGADRLRTRLTTLAETQSLATLAERRERVRRRLAPRVAGVAAAIEAAGSLYAFDRLHRVRIAVKKLRYLLELAHEATRVGTARMVRRLKAAQDLLGRLHDLEVVAGFVRMTLGLHPAHAVGLRDLLDVIERETRQRHAEYLRLVPRLTAVLETCRTDLDQRLARHG
jgi:CHAD domain-containing protein